MPYLRGAQYYATPENDWAVLFLEYVPDWMIVQDPDSVKRLYEGNPAGLKGVPWGEPPILLGWMPFVIALYLVMIALMVILRRQWMNNERLLYPLMQAPLAMVQQDRKRRRPQRYRIPFESFANHAPRLHPADGDVWRLNLYRTGGSVNVQHIAWSNTRVEKPQFHMP